MCQLGISRRNACAFGITGLTGVSRTDREVWEEFHRNPEPLCFEAATSLAAYSELPITVPDQFDITELTGGEREVIRRIRTNQWFFREMILASHSRILAGVLPRCQSTSCCCPHRTVVIGRSKPDEPPERLAPLRHTTWRTSAESFSSLQITPFKLQAGTRFIEDRDLQTFGCSDTTDSACTIPIDGHQIPTIFHDASPPVAIDRERSRIRGKDTKPELVVRSYLHGCGLRFRLHRSDLPGRPDLTLARHQTVILIHGCFWHLHSCPFGRGEAQNQRSVLGSETAR